jgi:hypothetical protein
MVHVFVPGIVFRRRCHYSVLVRKREFRPSNSRQMQPSPGILLWRQDPTGKFRVSLESSILEINNTRHDEKIAVCCHSDGQSTLNIASNDENEPEKTDDSNSLKPDVVLQYERQRRKAQHSKKAGKIVSVYEHLHPVYVDESVVVVSGHIIVILVVIHVVIHLVIHVVIHHSFLSLKPPIIYLCFISFVLLDPAIFFQTYILFHYTSRFPS